jgi:hypothetical protein
MNNFTQVCEGQAPIYLKRDADGNILLVDVRGLPMPCGRIDIYQAADEATTVSATIYPQGWFDDQESNTLNTEG